MSREALLVLGMHRSGTSATAGLLVRLGAYAPLTLVPGDATNPEGHWESAPLGQFHEKLLREGGSRWDDYTRFELPPHAGIAASLDDECRRVLRAEFRDAPRFVLKDPRMCRFVPFWLRILEGEGIVPTAVLVVRSALEVARSLGVRNGLDEELSLLMWLRHVLDAEFGTRGIPRTFVGYDDVVRNWRWVADEVARNLEAPWTPRTPVEDAAIDQFVNPSLRHHHVEHELAGLPAVLADWVKRTFAALRRLQHGARQPEALLELDTVRLEFDRATVALGVSERIRARLENRVANLQVHATNLEAHAENLQAHAQNLQSRVWNLEDQVGSLHSRTESLQHRLAALQRHSDAVDDHSALLEREIMAFRQNRDVMQQSLSSAEQEVKALRESSSWKITAPLRAVYRLLR